MGGRGGARKCRAGLWKKVKFYGILKMRNSAFLIMRDRLMVGLQILDLAILVRIQVPQSIKIK